MPYDRYTGDDDDQRAKIAHALELFAQVRNRRAAFEAMWEESAAIVWPEYRNSFTYGHARTPGLKYTEYQLDSRGAIALHRFMAVCDAMMTPFAMPWSPIRASDDDLMKDRSVALYYEQISKILWRERYRPEANFLGSQQVNWQGLGAFGNQNMLLDELDTNPGDFRPGIRYVPCSPGEIYLLVNHQGRVDGFIRHFRWTARQACQRWKTEVPEPIKRAEEQKSQERFDFIQIVMPRSDYAPTAVLTNRGKPYSSCYISIAGQKIMEEGGYRRFPLANGRYIVAPEEEYGRGPAQMVLPALKTRNAEKGMFLNQGHRAGDPAYLLPGDDSLFDFKSHPGAYNYGGVSDDGKPLVHILPHGNIQLTQEMMQEEAVSVDDAFLVSLYAELFDATKRGNAQNMPQVMQALADRMMFLAPTLGGQFEYLATMVDRELDILAYQRKFPPPPPALKEARGQYQTIARWASPMGRALKAPATLGFMRTVAMANESVKAGADPAIMDIFDFETAYPEIADDNFTPASWMASKQQIARKAQARAKAAAEDRRVKSLPGEAAMAKARAISDKAGAGMNIGGVLSGTAEGGMPMMPGQSAPGGRAF